MPDGIRDFREAAEQFTPELDVVFYNAKHNFTLQYPVLLAPLQIGDAEPEIVRKIRIAAEHTWIFFSRGAFGTFKPSTTRRCNMRCSW